MSSDIREEKQMSLTGPTSPVDANMSKESVQDGALEYLHQHAVVQSFASDELRMARLRHKIDLRMIPFMFLVYLMNYLDKVIVNYANVMGLSKDLRLKGNEFTNAATAFWAAVLIAALPNVLILQKLPTAKWLSICLLCWGVVSSCTAATKNYSGLLTVRIFCGIFESAIPPSLMLLTGQYYTRVEQVTRFALWYGGTGLGFLLGGLISWAFQHISPHTSGLESWKIMFVALGCVTVVLAAAIFFLVPDTPMHARFLTEEEKVSLLEHVKINMTGIENKRFKVSQLLEALTDISLWGLMAIQFLQGIGGGVITTYSATLIKGFGYSSERSALLNMGSGAVLIVSIVLCVLAVRLFGHRWAVVAAVSVPAIIGASLMAWLPTSNKTGRLAGIYLVNVFIGSTPIIFQWLVTNIAGNTKRAYATQMLAAAFALGNVVGPQTFQAKDAPEYTPAKITMVVAQALVIVISTLLFVYYKRANKKQSYAEDVSAEVAFAGRTDKQNSSFRYAY